MIPNDGAPHMRGYNGLNGWTNTWNTWNLHDIPRSLIENQSQTHPSSGTVVFNFFMVVVCISCASVACGLTQGLLSLNPLEMNVKMRSGSSDEKQQASRVLPLITRHHLLLVTLMLFNATANEALPLFLNQLVPAYVVIILSVTLVLCFGEIIPSAFFTGPNQLRIASFLAPFTWLLICFLYPIAYPLSKALDFWLGDDDGMTMFNRSEIFTMMQIQQEEAPKRGVSTQNSVIHEEVNMIGGALKLRDKVVEDIMTKDVFMLSINEKLTIKTLWKIFHSGCSRIPIFETDRNDVMGIMLVKDLLFIDPDDALPIRNFMAIFGRPIQTVWPDQRLHEVLKLFKKSHIHLAIVQDVNSDGDRDPFYEVKGIITMEDIFEELIGEEIMDETEAGDVIYSRLRGFNPDVDFAQLKHIAPESMLCSPSDNKLSSEEVKSIVSFLNSQVPQIAELLGEDNMQEIQKLVESSQVISIRSNFKLDQSKPLAYESNQTVIDLLSLPLDEIVSDSTAAVDIHPANGNDDNPNPNINFHGEIPVQTSSNISDPAGAADAVNASKYEREYLYKRDRVTNACTLILSGELKVVVGKEEFEIVKGPWSILAADVLISEDGILVSDFSAYVASSEFRCLRMMKPKRQPSLEDTSQVHANILSSNRQRYRKGRISTNEVTKSISQRNDGGSNHRPRGHKTQDGATDSVYNPILVDISETSTKSSNPRDSSRPKSDNMSKHYPSKSDRFESPSKFRYHHPTSAPRISPRRVSQSPVLKIDGNKSVDRSNLHTTPNILNYVNEWTMFSGHQKGYATYDPVSNVDGQPCTKSVNPLHGSKDGKERK